MAFVRWLDHKDDLHYKSGTIKKPLPYIQFAKTWVLDISPSSSVKNKIILLIHHFIYDILLQQPGLTDKVSINYFLTEVSSTV